MSAEGLAQTRALIAEKGKTDIETEIIVVDVSSEESVNSMVRTVVEKWGRIDYAVNGAGMVSHKPGCGFVC